MAPKALWGAVPLYLYASFGQPYLYFFRFCGLIFYSTCPVLAQWVSIFQDGILAQWFEKFSETAMTLIFLFGTLVIIFPSSFAFLVVYLSVDQRERQSTPLWKT